MSKLKDFSRSHAVTYTVVVVMSWKQCKVETLLVQTTYHSIPFLMTLSDLEGHSPVSSVSAAVHQLRRF